MLWELPSHSLGSLWPLVSPCPILACSRTVRPDVSGASLEDEQDRSDSRDVSWWLLAANYLHLVQNAATAMSKMIMRIWHTDAGIVDGFSPPSMSSHIENVIATVQTIAICADVCTRTACYVVRYTYSMIATIDGTRAAKMLDA